MSGTGAAWTRQAAINTINFTDSTPLAFAVAYPDTHTANVTTTLDTQVANRAFLGPVSGADAAPTFRDIDPLDLPDATASTKGIIQPGTGLAVNAGVLNHSNSATAGTFTKVTIDTEGHVTVGALLDAADVPVLDAAKITTGELPTDRVADNAITSGKLADYSTASIGEGLPVADFIGQIHLNPLDRAFFMWDGNVYVPIGISAGQIIFAGTFDASDPAGTGKVASVTPEGAAAGFTVGSALPASSLANNRHYLVVSEGGTINTGNAPHVALAPPDLILSVYSTTSPAWVEIDVSSGAGAIAASQVSFNPAASIAATNVQTALEEVSTECRNATNITSGTLAVARGGTGLVSYAKGNILAASAATTLNALTVGTNAQVLRANSATATGLEWGNDFVGTVTDVTSSTGALTIATSTTTPALTIRAATTSVDGIVQLS
jgi:trimeric autotransporter adhesin